MYLPAGITCCSVPSHYIHTVLEYISKVTCHLLQIAFHHGKNKREINTELLTNAVRLHQRCHYHSVYGSSGISDTSKFL